MKFKREQFLSIIDEALPLIQEHFKEVDAQQDLGLDIDIERYCKLEELDCLRIYTLRNEADELIGYACFIISNHLHYKRAISAAQDVIYIKPEFRGEGHKFIARCDQELHKQGVDIVSHFVTPRCDFSKTLTKLGYQMIETVYARRLDKI